MNRLNGLLFSRFSYQCENGMNDNATERKNEEIPLHGTKLMLKLLLRVQSNNGECFTDAFSDNFLNCWQKTNQLIS